MAVQFEISEVFPASPKELYDAWLDSDRHAEMTGGGASVDPVPGGSFTAWDGYISGTNLELVPHERIVQAWRTVEFAEKDPESRLELVFRPVAGGTEIVLRHTALPSHGHQYEQGWVDNYFIPMKAYFGA